MTEPVVGDIRAFLDAYSREGLFVKPVSGVERDRRSSLDPDNEIRTYFFPKQPSKRAMRKAFTREGLIRGWNNYHRIGFSPRESNVTVYDFDHWLTKRALKLIEKLDTATTLTPGGFHVLVRFCADMSPDNILLSTNNFRLWSLKYRALARRFERVGLTPDPMGPYVFSPKSFALLAPSVIQPVYQFAENWRNAVGEYRLLNPDLNAFKIREFYPEWRTLN